MEIIISEFLGGINNEYTISTKNINTNIYAYSITPYPEGGIDKFDKIQFSICDFIVNKDIFPVFFHIKSGENELLSESFQYNTIITFNSNKRKEYYFRIEVNSKDELTSIVDLVFMEGVVGNLLLLTPEKDILFLQAIDKNECSKPELAFDNDTYYIWVGYDGDSWELISNESIYSYENLKKCNKLTKNINYLLDEERYDY